MAVGAGISLVVAAAAVLGIGQAIRRVIDVGFGMGNGSYLDLYFSALFGVVAVLAIATFGRFYCVTRSEEHTSELQSLMRISYAVFCLKIKHYLDTAYD